MIRQASTTRTVNGELGPTEMSAKRTPTKQHSGPNQALPPGDALMDTSLLLLATESPSARAELVDFFRTNGLRLIAPSAGMDESLVSDSAGVLKIVASGVVALFGALGESAQFAKFHCDIWKAEYEADLQSLPVVDPARRRALLDLLATQAQRPTSSQAHELRSIREAVSPWKAKRAADAAEVKARASASASKEAFAPEAILELLDQYSVAHLPEFVLQPQLEEFCQAGPGAAATVLANVARCPALKTWLPLIHLTMIAEINGEELAAAHTRLGMLAPNKNDAYDAAVASPAAYCKYFLTLDERLYQRCNFLESRGLVRFHTIRVIRDHPLTFEGLPERAPKAPDHPKQRKKKR